MKITYLTAKHFPMEILGIDIGGSGIKGATVNTETGELTAERHRIPTPKPATPEAVAETIAEIIRHFDWNGPIGCGFPGLIRSGTVKTAANMDDSWQDREIESFFTEKFGMPTFVLNDADAAGLAEYAFGAGHERMGTVLLLTLGTGIGSVLFRDGVMVPATELGHVEFKGQDAERYCADSVRERLDLSWKKWGRRVNEFFVYMEMLFSPDLIIIGGGVSKKIEKYEKYLETQAEVVPAELRNEAGIVGAAIHAQQMGRAGSPSIQPLTGL